MSIPDFEKFNSVVGSLIESTSSGSIDWSRVNPTTYVWTGANGRVSIQQVASSVRTATGVKEFKRHIIQVVDQSGEPQLIVNSSKSTEADEILRQLFVEITSAMTEKGVDFLASLLGDAVGQRHK